MKFKFKFKFGREKTTIYQFAAIGFVLSILVPFLSKMLAVDELAVFDFVDETQRLWFPGGNAINDYFIKHPELLARRVERTVDSAIDEYNALTGATDEVIIEEPVFTEDLSSETALGGELRLSSPWETNPNQQDL